MLLKNRSNISRAFTIVELLIVVVVIGVLASISLISYRGISQRAVASAIESDLVSARNKINIFYVDNDTYPISINECPSPSSVSICLNPSTGNSFDYVYDNLSVDKYYRLTETNVNGISYYIDNNSQPIMLQDSPLGPIADWVAVPDGNHYGNFYDLISKQSATAIRSTTSTVYDANLERIFEVPVDKIGMRPRSDGAIGYEALIEESETNFVRYSSFENSSVGWSYQVGGYGSMKLVTDKSVHGSYSMKIDRTAVGSEANVYNNLNGLTASTTYYYSVWTWADTPNSACIFTYNSTTNVPNTCNSGQSKWERIGGTFVSSGTGSVQLRLANRTLGANVYFDAVQVEDSNFPSSFIPTTSSSVNRSSLEVTIPTVSSYSEGTVVGVIAKGLASNRGIFSFGNSSSSNITMYSNTVNTVQAYFINTSPTYGPSRGTIGLNSVVAWRWSSSGSQQSVDGSHSEINAVTLPTGAPSNISYIGGFYGGYSKFSSGIHRLVIYPTKLSDSNIDEIADFIKSGI